MEIIHDNENIIGYSWDIAEEIESELELMDEGERSLFQELIDELEKYDGLVRCNYHPMGSYFVEDLAGSRFMEDVIAWIYDHDTLAKDFERHFGTQFRED